MIGRAAELQATHDEDRELVDRPMRIEAFGVRKQRGNAFLRSRGTAKAESASVPGENREIDPEFP